MNGLSQETAMVVGVGFFLAFEVALCTGLVLSKLKKIAPDAGQRP